MIIVVIGLYDTLSDQFRLNWPTVADWIPQWQWWAWVMLLLVVIIVAVVEGSYCIGKDKSQLEEQLKQKENKNFSIAWVNGESLLRIPNGYNNYWEDESDGLSLLLRGVVSVTTIGTIRVESVKLDMGGQSYASNWASEEFYTSEERDVEFEFPLDTPRGKRNATLKAIIDGQPYISKVFTLNLPVGKQVFHMEGSLS